MTIGIDINADLGEGFPNDLSLLDLVTSASVSCGAHAGDLDSIRATLAAAKERRVVVGAHPGYPDPENFGRRDLTLEDSQVSRLITAQFESLSEIASGLGVQLRFIKPHGALYNQGQRDEQVARGVVLAVRRTGLPLLGQSGTVLEQVAASFGVPYITEGFADRRYEPDGKLVPRTRPDALLHNDAEIEAQVVRLVSHGLKTLCIHGDDPNAVANARRLRLIFAKHGIEPRFWGRTDSS